MTASPGAGGPWRLPLALLQAAHGGPCVAVAVLAGLLAVAHDLPAGRVALVAAAVFAGQLTIGWANDLLDAGRDRTVGRTDKPLADGRLRVGQVGAALLLATLAAVALSAALGWRSALVHLVLLVGSGQVYNLGAKATVFSWLPYAVAFGSLPAVVTLAASPPEAPPAWLVAAGALLGVAAHFLNVLPDLADDAATGVRGLPHRLGSGPSRAAAAVLLVAASLVALAGHPGRLPAWGWGAATLALTLGLVVLRGRGRAPFQAAVGVALLDVVLLVVVSR